jgi:hypothetical protein
MPISRMQQPRQMYGLGSFVKKAVKGVTNAVKSVAKSDIGKIAGLAALSFGIPGTQFGGLFGRAKMFGPATGMFGYQGIGPTLGAFKATPIGEKIFGTAIGDTDMTRSGGILNFLKSPKGAATAIGATSLLGGMLTPKAEEDVQALRSSGDQGLLKAYLERYYKNLNPDAIQKL